MLQSKDIDKIAELKNGFTPRWLEPDSILSSLKGFSFSAVCKCLAPLKQKGYSFESIFSCLICLPYLGLQTVHSFTGSAMADHIKARKDVFYRLKNNPKICWRVVLWMFGIKFIELIRLLEVLFEGTDKMELWGKIFKDERAYEMIERLLPKEPELQKAA